MRLRQATNLGEGHRIHQESNDQQPRITSHGQQDSPAQKETDHQIGDYRHKKFHDTILASFAEIASPWRAWRFGSGDRASGLRPAWLLAGKKVFRNAGLSRRPPRW